MNVLDVLKYGNLTVLRTVEGLPEADWHTGGVTGYWSTKDIIAHLASFESMLVDVLNTFLDGGETPVLGRSRRMHGDEFNAYEVGMRKDMTVAETLEEYRTVQASSMELAARIPAEVARQPGKLPWYGREYALDDFIVYTFYGHKREHSAQINVFRDTLK